MNKDTTGSTPTRPSILERIKNWDDKTAWEYFDTKYRKLIFSFALSQGLDVQNAKEVTQDTLLAVAKAIKEFKYDRERSSFKNWLYVVARNKIYDRFRKDQRKPLIQDQPKAEKEETEFINKQPDPKRQFEELWDRNFLEVAREMAKEQASEKQYQIYDALEVKHWSVDKVMKLFDINRNQLDLAKSRVRKLVEEAVSELMKEVE